MEYFFDTFVVTLFYLSLSYCISLKYLLFENIAHDESFQHFVFCCTCTWLYLAVSVCTQLYLPSFLYGTPANYRLVTLLVCLTTHSNNITMAWHGGCLFLQLTDFGDWCATQSIKLPLPSFQTKQPIFFPVNLLNIVAIIYKTSSWLWMWVSSPFRKIRFLRPTCCPVAIGVWNTDVAIHPSTVQY